MSDVRSNNEEATKRNRILIQRAKSGNVAARDALLTSNHGLILHCAKQYCRPGGFVDMDDLIQQGRLGLLRAIDKFDVQRRARGRLVAFATYARLWIQNAMIRELENQNRTVRLPNHIHWNLRSFMKTRVQTILRSGDFRDDLEIAKKLGFTKQHLDTLHTASAMDIVPLEVVLREDDESVERHLPNRGAGDEEISQHFYEGEAARELEKILSPLPHRERFILQELYGFGTDRTAKTTEAIGRRLGISRGRVLQLKDKAIKRIHQQSGVSLQSAKGPAKAPPSKRWIPNCSLMLPEPPASNTQKPGPRRIVGSFPTTQRVPTGDCSGENLQHQGRAVV
jgi:RNA polymerase sigma factor (sigma-70 family)